jgi:competence protein ComEC
MYLFAFAFVIGVFTLHAWGALPAGWSALSLLSVVLIRWPPGRALAGLACGFCWAAWQAYAGVSQVLDPGLEGRTVLVEGQVQAQPLQLRGSVTRLQFHVDRIQDGSRWISYDADIRLGWYLQEPPPQPGERWQLAVRLKRPHGFANPGGFDYERWLFQQGIRATGYVREDARNQRLAAARLTLLQSWRLQLARLFGRLDARPALALVQALTIGERNAMTTGQWDVLNATGTSHLMAISGLHISLVAALAFRLTAWLWCRLGTVATRVPARRVAAAVAMTAALVYALLAGFGIPARRALIMVTLFMLALLGGRRVTFPAAILLAAAVTLLIDPQAVLSAGWWLSFLAVTLIAWLTYARYGRPHRQITRWMTLQVALVAGMTPLLLSCFQQASLVAPLANGLAIPVVGLLVVPLALTGVLLALPSEELGGMVLYLAAGLLEWLWPLLEWLAQLPLARITSASPSFWALLFALAGLLLLLMPRGLPARWLAPVLCLPLLSARAPAPFPGDLELTVLDVGQGLAVVLQTAGHVLVYDTGARFSPTFDAGSAVLIPFLTAHGIRTLDTLLVSHGDNDHIGGASALLRQYRPDRILSSVPGQLAGAGAMACQAGDRWEWDGVQFDILHPPAGASLDGNDASCVLRAQAANGMSVLLTGDIEQSGEAALLQSAREQLPADVLVAPHHGSATSSSRSFIAAVSPQLVIFPAGYRNRYRFPAAEVVRRYRQSGAQLFQSGHDGAVSVSFSAHAEVPVVRSWRAQATRFWHWRE